MFWPPYPGLGYMPTPQTSPTLDQIIQAERFYKELRKEFKEEEEKKKNKTKPLPKFNILEVTGILMLFGPALGLSYLYGLYYIILQVNQMLSSLPHVNPN